MAQGVTRRDILETLDRLGDLSAAQVADELNAEQRLVKDVVDELEREGMVTFEVTDVAGDPASRASTRVRLEDKGRQALASGF